MANSAKQNFRSLPGRTSGFSLVELIIVIAIMAAVITPTVDPLNMALVMGPLIVLYAIGILLAKLA